MIATILLVCVINPWIFILMVPLVGLFLYIRKYYLATGREIKRLEAVLRSPLYAHITTSVTGAATIRSQGNTERAIALMHENQDAHVAVYSCFLAISRWLGVRLDLLTFMLVSAVVFTAIPLRDQLAPALVGLSLSFTLRLTASFQWCVRQSAEIEGLMTSVERALEYTNIEAEPDPPDSAAGGKDAAEIDVKAAGSKGRRRKASRSLAIEPPSSWPDVGTIVFDNVEMHYSPTLPPSLRDVSFILQPGDKVGVVGRTGAGKSSLLAALFRMTPIASGDILIDGISTGAVSLARLRRSISVIPQDPVLFTGSVRYNLDPFNEYNDELLWKALAAVQLKDVVSQLPEGE